VIGSRSGRCGGGSAPTSPSSRRCRLSRCVDQQIAGEAHKLFLKQGLKINLGAKIGSIDVGEGGVLVRYVDNQGAEQSLACERLIVSIGRVPYTAGVGAEAIGLKIDERGQIEVDAECRTQLPGIWAIGDAVRGPMLAHKAEEEGVAVAERLAGQHGHVDFNTVPWVIYTSPEIAWVGQTEEQLKAGGRAYRAGDVSVHGQWQGAALGDTSGMVKVLADAKTDEVLGVHIVGHAASELIRRGGGRHGVQGFRRGHRPRLPRPSVAVGGDQGSALAVDERALNF
jgi:dihydrolipoamide dehydrogenase